MSKQKQLQLTAQPPVTRAATANTTKPTTITSLGGEPNDDGNSQSIGNNADPVSKSDLELMLNKLRDSFKEDMTALVQQSTTSLQTSVTELGQQVTSFNSRLTETEVRVGENFHHLTEMDAVVKSLQSKTERLEERVDELENHSRRSNIRVINLPETWEKDEDPVGFMSDLLMQLMGPGVFPVPPEIERAHRSAQVRYRYGKTKTFHCKVPAISRKRKSLKTSQRAPA